MKKCWLLDAFLPNYLARNMLMKLLNCKRILLFIKKKKGRLEGAKRGTQRVELRTTEDFSQVWKPNGVSAGGFQI